MEFDNYEIPKEYKDKFKITAKDKREFKKFWNDTIEELTNFDYLEKEGIKILHKTLMDGFWNIKSKNKEKYTPKKYKNNIYLKE